MSGNTIPLLLASQGEEGIKLSKDKKNIWLSVRQWSWRAALTMVLSTQALAQQPIDIPAQSLADALNELGEEAGLQIIYDANLVAGINSKAVQGTVPTEVLRQLLDGTGVRYAISGNSVTLIAQGNDGAISLPPVKIAGDSISTTTEGTGSYTTGTMSTATKLDLTLRETPQAVTVITRQRMEDEGIIDLVDAIKSTPGVFVNITDGAGRPTFLSRGFYAENVTYDGAVTQWQGTTPNAVANLAMFDRVEVVRGATGLTQGAGNPSAAINLVRKRPTAEFQTLFDVGVGRWNNYSGMIDVSGPVTKDSSARARIVGYADTKESFRDNDGSETNLIYGIVETDIGKDTLLTVGAHVQKDQIEGMWWGGLPVDPDGGHLDLPRSTSLASDWEYLDYETASLFANLEHQLANDWTIKLSTLFLTLDTDLLGAYLVTDVSVDPVTRRQRAWHSETERTQKNYELTASGPFSLLGRDHELVFGATRNQLDDDEDKFSLAYVGTDLDIYNWDSSSLPRPDLPYSRTVKSTATQDSAYVTTRLNPTDPLKVILGMRLDWYEYDIEDGDGDYKIDDQVTNYAGVIYDLNQQHSIYASYTDIFEPQSSEDANGNTLEPVVGENYEMGIKGEYFGGSLNTSAAIYKIYQTNRARSVADTSLCSPEAPTCYEASGEISSEGVDLEVQGALSDYWEIGAGYTYNETEYVKDSTFASGTIYKPEVPKQLFKLTTSYTPAGKSGRWRFGTSLNWQDKIYRDGRSWAGDKTTDTVRNEQDAYFLVDMMAQYKINSHLKLQLNIDNLFDKEYYSGLGADPQYAPRDYYGEPRNFKLHLTGIF
ncbi:TonB-dependent siderophore receptor [Oceanobacter antarcticus]|uniref:TonB-dependent siderophore receptor n=1 Tax=Oceanobacter antarcticus TaxID=3133425 RepID=A0ABW8NP88_9GAMM